MKLAVFSACPELYDGGQFYQDALRCSENYLDTLNCVKDMGLDGIELASCDPRDFSAEDLEAALTKTGMGISMFGNFYWCTKNDLSMLSTDTKKAELAVELFKKMIRIGAPYGIPAGLGRLRGGAIPDKPIRYSLDRLTEILKDVAGYAEMVGGLFCIEPQNRFGMNMINTTQEGIEIIDRVGSDTFKLTMDLQHMYIEEDIVEGLYKGRDYIYNLHLMEGFGDLKEQCNKIDFPKVMKVLSSTGFDGWISFTLPKNAPQNVSQYQLAGECTSFVRELLCAYCTGNA